MNNKIVFLLAVMLMAWLCLSGCSNNNNDGKQMNALDKTITGTDTSKSSDDDTLIEIKHWKYSSNQSSDSRAASAAPESSAESEETQAAVSMEAQAVSPTISTPSSSDKVVTIQLVTEKDMEQIISKLIDLGLMEKYAASEDEFQKAITDFQKENGLPATGTLDSATLQILKK